VASLLSRHYIQVGTMGIMNWQIIGMEGGRAIEETMSCTKDQCWKDKAKEQIMHWYKSALKKPISNHGFELDLGLH